MELSPGQRSRLKSQARQHETGPDEQVKLALERRRISEQDLHNDPDETGHRQKVRRHLLPFYILSLSVLGFGLGLTLLGVRSDYHALAVPGVIIGLIGYVFLLASLELRRYHQEDQKIIDDEEIF